MEQVCSALQFAHDHNVVLADIKPANTCCAATILRRSLNFGTAMIFQSGAAKQDLRPGHFPLHGARADQGQSALMSAQIFFPLGVDACNEMTTAKRRLAADIATIL